MKYIRVACFCLLFVLLPLITVFSDSAEYAYEIIKAYPHDPGAFTQGLAYEDGFLYESTGLYGRSTLRKANLETGEVLQVVRLPDMIFGEGITICEDKIFQLSWQSRKGFIYDKKTLELTGEFNYPYEGWGIAYDGKYLIVSDGSPRIYFLDPENFKEVRRIEVSDGGNLITNINELEFINGEIYANIWRQERIARISPRTGEVIAWAGLEGILGASNVKVDVLNGIAYDKKNDRLFVTGKFWPKIFVIKLTKK